MYEGAHPGPASNKRRRTTTARKSQVSGRRARPRRSGQRSPALVRRSRRRLLAALYAAMLVEVIVALLTSPMFAVRRVEVRGHKGITAREGAVLLRAAALPRMTNWFRAPVGPLSRRVSALPYVAAVQIHRRLPYTIEVAVQIRQPYAILRTPSGLYELDRAGVAIRPARRGLVGRLPDVEAQSPMRLRLGAPALDFGVEGALAIEEAAARDNLVRIARIEVDSGDNLCLNMVDGLLVLLGKSDDLNTKLSRLHSLYAHEPGIAARVVSVNLTCPTAPAYTPRTAAAATSQPGDSVPVASGGVPISAHTAVVGAVPGSSLAPAAGR